MEQLSWGTQRAAHAPGMPVLPPGSSPPLRQDPYTHSLDCPQAVGGVPIGEASDRLLPAAAAVTVADLQDHACN